MKSKLDGEFFFTLFLAIFVVGCLIDASDFHEKLQGAVFITGSTTLLFIGLLLVGHFYPEILRWTETTLQDLWGSGGTDTGAVDNLAETSPPWPAVWKSMAYAVGFLILSFLFGFYLVPPIFLATYLIVEAKVKPIWAITTGVVATAALTTGMTQVAIEVWVGAIPEILPQFLGGAFIPPI
jgi:hypothetical protein